MPAPIDLPQLLPAAHILLLPENPNKKRTFEQAALLMENISGLSRNELFRQFMERERQGSTSIGFHGAIPHIHMPVEKPLCVLARLRQPIQYDADNAPTSTVHTLFFLITPEGTEKTHLRLLALFSRLLADEAFMARMGKCADSAAIHQTITDWSSSNRSTLDDIWAE